MLLNDRTVSYKTILTALVLCLTSFGIFAQSRTSDNAVKVSYKQYDSQRKQFFVQSADGKLFETGFYRANKPDLTWIQYNEAGEKQVLAQFQNGLKQGIWYIWDEEGFLKYEIHYVNNNIYRALELDHTGGLVANR